MGKLRQYIIDNIPTDIEIILLNSYDTIKIQSHKCILGCYFDYFHNLFNYGKEKNQSSVVIKVENVKVARDLILSFDKQNINTMYNEIRYLLEMFKCRNFFGMNTSLIKGKNDVELLYDITVPPDDFELFMLVVVEFDFINDKRLIHTIKKNIPLDYDLNELQINDNLIVSGSSDHSIKIWNLNTGQLLNTLLGHSDSISSVAFSFDNMRIVSGCSDGEVKIWDSYSGQLLNTLNEHIDCCVSSVAFSPDGLRIASTGSGGNIKICTYRPVIKYFNCQY
jgi:WD40 repeat protein